MKKKLLEVVKHHKCEIITYKHTRIGFSIHLYEILVKATDSNEIRLWKGSFDSCCTGNNNSKVIILTSPNKYSMLFYLDIWLGQWIENIWVEENVWKQKK